MDGWLKHSHILHWVFVLYLLEAQAQIREGEGGGEFCMTESFQASCAEDEVIIMDTALYGRMSLGRCVKTDFGFVGCSTDVLDLADSRCSGRRRCAIRVPDPLLENTKPCNEEFKSYLQTSYSCVRVVSAQPRLCQVSQHLKLTAESGYLANVVTEETGCGAEDVPWVIEAKPGQRINISLYDFARVSETGNSIARTSRGCVMYAYIREKTSQERVSVCGGGERERHVFTSVTSTVTIHVVKSYLPEGKRHFMLHYQAIGCPDIIAPGGSWVQRDGDVILMGCKGSDDEWRLTCDGHSWHGRKANCTADDPNGAAASMFGVLSLPVGAAITLILAIAVGVSALILLAGLLVIKRRRFDDKNAPRRTPNPSIILADGTLRRPKDDPRFQPPESAKLPYSRQSLGGGGGGGGILGHPNDNEYAYVWETHQSNVQQSCRYCSDSCNLNMNIHDVECGHYGVSCTGAPAGEESMYEKSTYSTGRQYEQRGGGGLVEHGLGGPQYYELDPEGIPKKPAPGKDTLPASLPGGSSRDPRNETSLRKYNISEGSLETGREVEESGRGGNFVMHHISS